MESEESAEVRSGHTSFSAGNRARMLMSSSEDPLGSLSLSASAGLIRSGGGGLLPCFGFGDERVAAAFAVRSSCIFLAAVAVAPTTI
jgi:hypothetical protein